MKFFAFIFLFVAMSCARFNSSSKNSSSLADLFKRFSTEKLEFQPLEATQQGQHQFDHLLPNDQTAEFREKMVNFYKKYKNELLTFDPSKLNENDKISYDIFKYDLEIGLEGEKFHSWMIPFHQFWSLPMTIVQLGSGDLYQPFATVKDYENWLGRIDGFVTWSDSAIENFKIGMKNGYVLPKSLVIKTIPQLKAIVVKDVEKSIFYGPIKKLPASFTVEEKEAITKKYRQAIKEKIIPTYRKLANFLEKDYLPKSRSTSGLSSIPQGKELYSYLVKVWTTTEKTPDEIYQAGLAEVSRIRSEMEKVKNQVAFKGTLKQFFEHLRVDPQFTPFKSPEEILASFNSIHDKIKPQLKLMFNHTPITPFEIRQTEAFRAASASAEYQQGAPDGSRPGIFYVPILDAKKFNITSGMESLFLHEAIPGHHYQISLQQESKVLPDFRRFSWYGAYGEGWALYTESLGKELGLYQDPYQYMGALGDEMHRAIRLVVDVAIHLKGMTRERAIDYMMENEPINKRDATAEIERYMAIPGQALSYKIGSLKIQELRKKYQQQLGSKFEISEFHDEFLKDGCMPLAILEQKMDRWANHF